MSDKIKVVVKVRPLIAREIEEKLTNHWQVKDNTILQLDQNGKDIVQSYTFDKIYNSDTNTDDVYNDIAKPIVEAAVRGINGTIFAYGQTSSGKTYTMTGTEDSPGIVQLAVHDLFQLITNIPDRDFLLRVSYMEIYNEVINDLLDVEKKNVKIQIDGHQSGQCGGYGIKLDISEKVTSTPTEIFDIMKEAGLAMAAGDIVFITRCYLQSALMDLPLLSIRQVEGEVNRQVGETNMNKESSRSHSIFQIIIESRAHCENPQEECVHVSQLNLVDLAGSERASQTGATGKRFKEGTHINKSLSTLGLVIKQLAEKTSHISYRDSKLTRILQNSLGGNANTSIVCAVTPASIEETTSTLQFASRAKLIENKPVVNKVHTDQTKIQELTKEIVKLQMELKSSKSLEQNYKVLMKEIKVLRRQILNGSSTERPLATFIPRRATICATTQLQTIHEQPIQRPILNVPPFVPAKENKVTIVKEIIEIDSDDDDEKTLNAPCSPIHKCYVESKTPPCVLREKAKRAEENCRDIAELAHLEKIYSPSIIELKEEIQTKDTLIHELELKVKNLNEKCQEHETNVSKLHDELNKRNGDIEQTQNDFKEKCNSLDTKIAEWELSYETLKKKFKNREQELLSRLEEMDMKATVKSSLESSVYHFLDMSKDITLVTSDIDTSTVGKEESKEPDVQTLSNKKDIIIKELELEIASQRNIINTLESENTDAKNLRAKLEMDEIGIKGYIEENTLLKNTIDTLNSTIKSQKNSLETLTNDIITCNDAIKEIKSFYNEESMIDSMISIENQFTINNEHIQLLVNNFRNCLANKNTEIKMLKNQNNAAKVEADNKFKVIIEEKEKELNKVETELLQIKEKIVENQEQLSKLLKENTILRNNNSSVCDKLASVEDKNKCLQSKLEEVVMQKDMEIKELRANKESTIYKLKEGEAIVQEILTGNKDLHKQITKLNDVIENLEKDKSNQQNLILTLSQNKPLQDVEMKSFIDKTKNILCNLSSNENIEEGVNSSDEAVVILNNYLARTLTAVTNLLSEKRDIVENTEKLKNDLMTVTKKNLELDQNIKDNDELTEKCNVLVNKLQHTDTVLQSMISENDQLKNKVEQFEIEMTEKNGILAIKENELITLNEKNIIINTEKGNIEHVLKMKVSEYEEIKELLDSYISQNANDDNSQIKKLDQSNAQLREELQKCNLEIDTKSTLLNNILSHVRDLLKTLKDTYPVEELSIEQIPDHILNIKHHIKNFKLELTTESMKLEKHKEDYSKLKDDYQLACKTIETLRDENKSSNDNLMNLRNTLEILKTELNSKADQVNDLLHIVETLKQDLQHVKLENYDLKVSSDEKDPKIKELENVSTQTALNASEVDKIIIPSALSQICFNKVVNCLYIEESHEDAISCDSPVKTEIVTQKTCDCNTVLKTLSTVENENQCLKHKVLELTALNENLNKDMEEGRIEISLLTEQTSDLYKKILNHRAILSTFAATTFAENKLLKIQMKALLHHHTRMHKVCQRDVTDMKSKLGTLLRILQNDPNYSTCSLNNSLKRFSWPNAMTFNTSVNTLRHESNMTLDSDLLMIDTNVSLTTANNSTLVQDETCCSMTQLNVDSEYETRKTECILTTDKIYEELDKLVEENLNLKQQIEQLTDKNNKLEIIGAEQEPCKMCEHQNELKAEIENLKCSAKEYAMLSIKLKEITFEKENIEIKYKDIVIALDSTISKVKDLESIVVRLQDQVTEITTEKDDIQEKYQILSLKANSSDNLQRQVQNLESDCQSKSEDIAKLKDALKSNAEKLEALEQENINLSTELMDTISESDNLKHEIQELKTNNTKSICTECYVKDKNIELLLNNKCASQEDCVIDTINSQPERSNMSISQPMDLDESMTNSMPMVALSEHYSSDKRECLEFLTLQTNTHSYNEDTKIIDIMRKLYEFLISKHGAEVENLSNKITNFEESQKLLQSQLDDINMKHNNLCAQLGNRNEIISEFSKVIERIKNNIDYINEKISIEASMEIVNLFKENVLQAFDKEFSLPISPIFDLLLNNITTKHQCDINDMTEKYALLQNKMEDVLSELRTVNDTLTQTKTELQQLQEQYNVEREQVQQINSNVSAQLMKHNNELIDLIKQFLNSLIEKGIAINVEIECSSPKEYLLQVFAHIKESLLYNTKQCKQLESELGIAQTKLNEINVKVATYEEEFVTLKEDINMKEKQIVDQNDIITKLQVETENSEHVTLLTSENNKLKEELIRNKKVIIEHETEIRDIMEKIASKEEDIKALRDIHNIVTEERDLYNSELTDAGTKLKEYDDKNKAITLEMERLQNCLKEKINNIDELNVNAKQLFVECESLRSAKQELVDKVSMFEGEIGNKMKEIQQLQLNMKTVEKSVEIQNNIIKRITKEKESIMIERDNQISTLNSELATLRQMNEALTMEIERMKSKLDHANNKSEKRDSSKRDSIEHMNSDSFERDRRERRQSIFDNNRSLTVSPDDVEAMFSERAEPTDLFPDKCESNKRLSNAPRNEQECDRRRVSLSESISATRRRRQSIHDLHRTSLRIQLSDDEKLKAKARKSLENDDRNSLQCELESCRRELETLRARYEELDEECETCAKYLEERNEQCYALNADKQRLEEQVSKLTEQLDKFMQPTSGHVSTAHVAVNTDEDWSNLHAVVVDRMSYDAEVDKNKKLTRALEEFHIKNRDLKATVEKYEKKLNSVTNVQEISRLRSELSKSTEECKVLQQRVLELDQECDDCAEALKQAKDNCYALQDDNASLLKRIAELSAAMEKCTCSQNKCPPLNRSSDIKSRPDEFNMSVDEPDVLEELRQKNKELQHKLNKLQKKISRDSIGREMDAINEQLNRCKAENVDLLSKCRALSDKCEERQTLLQEREAQCDKLTEHKHVLEEKISQLQELSDKSMRSKLNRRSMHDQQREITNNTDACVSAMALEIQELKKRIETMKQQTSTNKTMYVDTGSAIVQNQQITDIMRENQKLRNTNEKLVQLCKKRAKMLSEEDRENHKPTHDS